MQAGRGVTSVRLATAAVVLIAAVVLRAYEIPPIPTWFYVLAWYPTLIILDELVVLLGGESLLARPGEVATMLWWSGVIWLVFEAITFRRGDWYYVFLPAGRLERWLGITVSLATVVPAVLLPERILDRLGVWRDLRSRSFALGPRPWRIAGWVGWGLFAAVLAFPRYLYPLTWGAVWLIAEPLLYRRDPERSLFAEIARGSWGRIARLMAAGLFAGVLWESFNALARGRWIYTVPFLEHWKIFEMPLVGFLGFPPQLGPGRAARGTRGGAARAPPRHRHRARRRSDRRWGGEHRGARPLRSRLGVAEGAWRPRRAPDTPGSASVGARRPATSSVAYRVLKYEGDGRAATRLSSDPSRRSSRADGLATSYGQLPVTTDQGISSTFPVLCRPSSSRCASAASPSGSSRSMRTRSVPPLIQPSTSPARATSSARVAM